MFDKLRKFFKDYFYFMYISNPILNPAVASISQIEIKARNGRLMKRYRVKKRSHFFDEWKVVGDYKTIKEAMNALH